MIALRVRIINAKRADQLQHEANLWIQQLQEMGYPLEIDSIAYAVHHSHDYGGDLHSLCIGYHLYSSEETK